MFKRRGRILFLDPGAGTRARMAEAWASALGGDWVEAHAARLQPGKPDPQTVAVMAERGVEAGDGPVAAWSSQQGLGWDLVVPLAVTAGEDWAAVLDGARVKFWQLPEVCAPGPEEDGPVDPRACRDDLRERVAGLLGGFRMKAREDADAQDQEQE